MVMSTLVAKDVMLGGIDELDIDTVDVYEGIDPIGGVLQVGEEWFGDGYRL